MELHIVSRKRQQQQKTRTAEGAAVNGRAATTSGNTKGNAKPSRSHVTFCAPKFGLNVYLPALRQLLTTVERFVTLEAPSPQLPGILRWFLVAPDLVIP